ncbi:MAG TPA: glycosyltransferase [Mycobacteriales bacterium]|nr:glycosyltransferase [Mycobacteriales bacterium]
MLAAAHRRGEEVLVIAPESMRLQVADAGLSFVPGAEPPEREVARIREQLPLAPPAQAIVLGNRELFGRLAARAMLPAMQDAMRIWRPDLLIREPCEYASAAVAVSDCVPTAQVAISVADGELASIEAAAPALEELRPGLTKRLISTPYLTRFPASLDPSPFPATVRFREPDRAPRPLPDWWPGVGGPLIYLTFGTVFGYLSGAGGAYRTVLQAVSGLPVRVLLTVGRRFDPVALGVLPANVHVEPWVEQTDALAAADLVLCHGGSGTTFGALAAGLPLIVLPAFADQNVNGRRIAAAGAGITIEAGPEGGERRGRLVDDSDIPRIIAAITAALTRPSYRSTAAKIAQEMKAAALIDDVLGALLLD